MSHAKIIQCQSCREYISSDAGHCRFCKLPIDPAIAAKAARQLANENKSERKRAAIKHMLIGLGVFTRGLVVTIGTYVLAASNRVGGNVLITYGLITSGGLDFLYGAWLWLSELKS